jgi:DNA-binding LacI/PurR family transcriptional regulator
MNWSIDMSELDIHRKPQQWLGKWQGDGIISRMTDDWLFDYANSHSVPVVELSDHGKDYGFHRIHNDDLAIGRLAANYFVVSPCSLRSGSILRYFVSRLTPVVFLDQLRVSGRKKCQ